LIHCTKKQGWAKPILSQSTNPSIWNPLIFIRGSAKLVFKQSKIKKTLEAKLLRGFHLHLEEARKGEFNPAANPSKFHLKVSTVLGLSDVDGHCMAFLIKSFDGYCTLA